MATTELLHNLDGARYVRVIEEIDAILVWKGGHTINLIDISGQALDTFSRGDWSTSGMSQEEAMRAVDEIAKELINYWLSENN